MNRIRTLTTACTLAALALLSPAALAQNCSLRNDVRLVHSLCQSGNSETRIGTGDIPAGPLLSTVGPVHDDPCGCHTEHSVIIMSDYGSLAYNLTSGGNSCTCCGVTLWADSNQGGPRARFSDRITPVSATLPWGTPVTLRATLVLTGGVSASNANTFRTFGADVLFNGNNTGFILAEQQGTIVGDYNTYVGSNVDIVARLNCEIREYTLLNTNQAGSFGANLNFTVRLEPVTPGFTISACSGHDYGALICDGVDFNNDGLFPDTQDIDDFLSVFAGGTCSTGNCGDIDFNNDGLFPDTADIDALLSVFSGGPCV